MGRLAGSWKAEMNSLRSDNISAVSPKPQPGSKDPFVRNVFFPPHPHQGGGFSTSCGLLEDKRTW